MRGKMYSSGKFAKLCGTTKDTLFLYDKKGLLKPWTDERNGYRYYTREHYLTFIIIAFLKEVGASLSEIAQYLSAGERSALMGLLEEKRVELARRQMELMRMQMSIDNIINSENLASTMREDEYRIVRMRDEHLITYPLSDRSDRRAAARDIIEEANSAIDAYMNSHGYPPYAQPGDITPLDDFMNGDYSVSHYLRKLDYPVIDPMYRLKPAGTYVTVYHKDNWNCIGQRCAEFRQHIINSGRKPVGDLYLFDVFLDMLQTDPDSRGWYMMIQVE